MNIDDITVIMVAANEKRNRGLILTALKSIEHFSDKMPNVIIADNGGNSDRLDRAVQLFGDKIQVVKNPAAAESSKNTSFRHGHGLNRIAPMVDTKYTVIFEPDCAVFVDKWFEFDTSKFDAKLAVRSTKPRRWHVAFAVFKTNVFKGMDWLPLIDDSKDLAFHVDHDTGFRMRHMISDDKIDIMEARDLTVFEHPIYEYNKTIEFAHKDKVIAGHFFRGSDINRRRFHHSMGIKPYKAGLQAKQWVSDVNKIMGEEEQMRKIFVDCGGHCGCSIKKFIKTHNDFECFTFEANPHLAKYYDNLPTTLITKAVWSKKGKTKFYLGGKWGFESSSLYEKKFNVDENNYVEVEQVNLGQWIKDNFNPEDYIVLKLDIEGAEYEVLEAMLKDGSLDYINELYGEEHYKKHGAAIQVTKERRDNIMSQVQAKLEFQDWCAQEDECIAQVK